MEKSKKIYQDINICFIWARIISDIRFEFFYNDKTFRGILKNKKEMSKFLKQFIGLEVKEEELEICDSNFINKHYERRESDIIYKNRNKEIYYLIEYQSRTDKNMPRRIIRY